MRKAEFRFIGKSLPRSEDLRLVRGLGRYTADLSPRDALRLVMVRSPHARARIRSIDTSAAEKLPGVALVLTGESEAIRDLGCFRSRIARVAPDGTPNKIPPYRPLTRETAQFVGDAVAAVFADTLDEAKDAAEALVIDWEPLPAIAETKRAADADAPQVWPEVPRNTSFLFTAGNEAAVEAAFATAAHTVSLTYDINRIIAAPMETRAALASFERATESWTLTAPLQNPHFLREELALVMGIPGNRLRVVSPDVGGAFGLKESGFPEYVCALVGAKLTGRPVLWVGERSESFAADHHARDNHSTVSLALNTDGIFLALKIETAANIGAYISSNGLHTPTNNLGGLSGVYRTPAIFARVRGVFTHTPPTSPYRGAGRPEATYAIERIVDLAADRLGLDPVDLRRRNLIAPEQMPYKTGFFFTYDSGEFERNMDDALKLADWAGFPQRRAAARGRGKLAGIGLANAIEISAGPITGPLSESAAIEFDSTGAVTVTVGTHSHGQGHEITLAQIVSDILGLAPDNVKIRYGDTDRLEHGTGTFGSRSVVAGSVALIKVADRLIARGKKIAAVHFETDAADVVFDAGAFCVAGTDRRLTLTEVAKLSFANRQNDYDGELGLSEKMIVAPDKATFPNGCHVCEVEIDPDTGACAIVRYAVVDDVGRMINPLLVKGQVHGGVAQGVGQILLENIAYDGDGQLVSGSFMDYAMPRASDLPSIDLGANEVLTPTNPLGVKGAGEAGTVGALAATVNAVVDALSALGIEHIEMPVTAERIWRAIAARR